MGNFGNTKRRPDPVAADIANPRKANSPVASNSATLKEFVELKAANAEVIEENKELQKQLFEAENLAQQRCREHNDLVEQHNALLDEYTALKSVHTSLVSVSSEGLNPHQQALHFQFNAVHLKLHGKILHREAAPFSVGRGAFQKFEHHATPRVGSSVASKSTLQTRSVAIEQHFADISTPSTSSAPERQIDIQAQVDKFVVRNKASIRIGARGCHLLSQSDEKFSPSDMAELHKITGTSYGQLREFRRFFINKTGTNPFASEASYRNFLGDTLLELESDSWDVEIEKNGKLLTQTKFYVRIVNVEAVLQKMLDKAVRDGDQLFALTCTQPDLCLWKIAADKGGKTTKLALTLGNSSGADNAKASFLLAQYDAVDSYENNSKVFGPTISKLAHCINHGRFSSGEKVFNNHHLLVTGDLEWLCNAAGIQKGKVTCPCPMCEFRRAEAMLEKPYHSCASPEGRANRRTTATHVKHLDSWEKAVAQKKKDGSKPESWDGKSLLAAHKNSEHQPLFHEVLPTKLTFCPPPLHIMLGLGNKVVLWVEECCAVLDAEALTGDAGSERLRALLLEKRAAGEKLWVASEELQGEEYLLKIWAADFDDFERVGFDEHSQRGAAVEHDQQEARFWALRDLRVATVESIKLLKLQIKETEASIATINRNLTLHKGEALLAYDACMQELHNGKGAQKVAYHNKDYNGNDLHEVFSDRKDAHNFLRRLADCLDVRFVQKAGSTLPVQIGSKASAQEAFDILVALAKCYQTFNRFREWTETEIDAFSDILVPDFAQKFKGVFPNSFPTKLHMLIVEMVLFARRFKTIAPLCGESFIEALHVFGNSAARRHATMGRGLKRFESETKSIQLKAHPDISESANDSTVKRGKYTIKKR